MRFRLLLLMLALGLLLIAGVRRARAEGSICAGAVACHRGKSVSLLHV